MYYFQFGGKQDLQSPPDTMGVMVMVKRVEGGLTPGTCDDQASPGDPPISATDPDETCYPDSLAIRNVLGI